MRIRTAAAAAAVALTAALPAPAGAQDAAPGLWSVYDQALSKARQGKDQAAKQATQAANKAQGVVHKATPSGQSEPADDITLARKVETEIFRAPDAPKGRVSVNAENGVVFLRGEIDDPQWITRLGDDAARVSGVAAVRNLLHTPATPAPTAPGTH